MRVISGSAKGTKLDSVPGDTTRPITDRVKTALFDTIRPRIQGKTILDLFGGSGSVGIEALSQGATHCTFLDLSRHAVQTIRANLERTKLIDQAEVKQFDAFKFLRNTNQSFDLVYIAPPQYKNLWVEAMHCLAERPERIVPGGEIIVQIHPKEYEKLNLTAFTEVSERKYGDTLLIFFVRQS